MSERREAVRASALYLRDVRPIDPEEIRTYVPGRPHPGVVLEDLRSLAPALELCERPDGTFVPASDEPVPPPSLPVRRLPSRHDDRLASALADRYGPDWDRGETGDRLRRTLRDLKTAYRRDESVTYDEDVAAAYAIYHLAPNYAAVQYALEDLLAEGLVSRSLRVLDVGAGVGGPALGLVDALPDDALLEYHAVEPAAGATILEDLLSIAGRNVHPTVHREPVETVDIDGRFDLICCCNVLSELESPRATLRWCLDRLAASGSLLALSPAEKRRAVALRALERDLEGTDVGTGTVTVYGPAVRFWPGETPIDRGWSVDVRPDLATPSVQRRLEDAATHEDHDPGAFVNVDVQFAYSILRLDGRRRYPITLDERHHARMGAMDRHVTNRVDLVAAKLSRPLQDDPDGNALYKLSDGSESVEHYAVCTRETATNRALAEADYGAPLAFEGALVLWNDDEGAYNLVVDDQTLVSPAG